MRKLKVANIVFNPMTNDSRVLKETISLSNNGYKVEVVAHRDKDLPKEERKENFIIRRFCYLDRKVTKSKFAKLKIYLQWVKEVIDYTKGFDILHCNDLNTLPIGVIVKKFYNKNVKIVYDAHEYETEIDGLKGIQKTLIKLLEKGLIKYADKTITVSDAIANEYVKLYNIEKPALVLNTPPYKKIEKKDIFRDKFNIDKETTVFLYQGGLSGGRGIEILLDTFKQFSNITRIKNQKSKTNIPTIIFMGYGQLEEDIKHVSQEYDNIYFHSAVSPEVLLDYTSSADFGILFYENNCLNHYYCSPNKMFEYIMAEIPVIVSNLYEMKKLVENNKIGVVAKENTISGLKEAIQKATTLDKNLLNKNIKNVKKIYNWEKQENVLLNVYEELN